MVPYISSSGSIQNYLIKIRLHLKIEMSSTSLNGALLGLIWLLLGVSICALYDVEVYHFIDNPLWGEVDGTALEGKFDCPGSHSCRFVSTDPKGVLPKDLMSNLANKYNKNMKALRTSGRPLSVGLYSIHSWAPVSRPPHHPDKCALKTDINIVESEESYARFHNLFERSFSGFDGNSTTHPRSEQYIT